MNYLKTYEEYNINEGVSFQSWMKIMKRIMVDQKLNLYAFLSFGLTVNALFPMVQSIIQKLSLKPITTTDIVILSIAAVSVLIHESKDDVNKLMVLVREKDLINPLNKLIEYLKSIFNILKILVSKMGKTFNTMVDMLAYTTIAVPFILTIGELVNINGIGIFDMFSHIKYVDGKIISLLIGASAEGIKHIIYDIINRLKSKLSWKKDPELVKLDTLPQQIQESFSF